MYVVRVIPIARGAFKEHLSFFSKEALPPGVVVNVAVRGKPGVALVVESKDAREEKLSLRSQAYALKKLTPKVKKRIFPRPTIAALRETARLHALPEGAVIAHFSPSAVTSAAEGVREAPEIEKTDEVASEKLVLQAESEERIRMYRNLTREAFARGQSVMVLAPTIPEAEALQEKLSRGIEEQVLMATSTLTKKATLAAWNRALEDPEPLLIIATHSFLTIPRANLSTIIVEHESSRAYTARERPHLDTRVAAEEVARACGARYIVADFPLRAETRARLSAGELDEGMRMQIAARGSLRVRVVDARSKENDAPKKKRFSPIAEYAAEALGRELARGGRAFVYASRRGVAPLTVCNDCGTPVTDPATGSPMTLQKTPEGNVFLSYRSGAVIPAHTPCRTCGGWNLVSLGIGVERVLETLKEILPGAPLLSLTKDAAATHAQAKKVQREFFSTAGAVLVGTDRALPYLKEPVELSVVASVDSILSSSAWRAHEYALHTLFFLRDRTTEELIVQTRQPEAEAMKAIASGNPSEFFEKELRERAKFGYPPAATFIGITWSGTERAVTEMQKEVETLLSGLDVVGPLPPRAVGRNRFQARAVIRLPKGSWPDDALIEKLKTLSPGVSIAVDPDDIV